jgi:hypothetical protein
MEIVVCGYFLISTYLAWMFLTGRSEWLDQKTAIGMLVKLFCSMCLGIFCGLIFMLIFSFRIIMKNH